jgi:hypothetical protein
MDNKNMFFMSFDADDAGRKIGQAILSDNPDSLREASTRIDHGNEIVSQWALNYGGLQYSSGGDQGVWYLPEEAIKDVENIRKKYESTTGMTLTVGIGETLSNSGKALLAGKMKGKNQVVFYSPELEEEIKQIALKVKEGHGSPEEQKLAESYIEPTQSEDKQKIQEVVGSDNSGDHSSNPSANEDGIESSPPSSTNLNHGYDSGYNNSDPQQRIESYQEQDMVAPVIRKPNLTDKPRVQEAVTGDVPESSRLMNEKLPDPEDSPAEDQKPDPTNYHGQAEGVPSYMQNEIPEENEAPDSMAQPQDKPSDLKYDDENAEQIPPQADIPEENATSDEAMVDEEESMGESRHCPSCTCGAHGETEEDLGSLLDQHLDNAQEFEDSIDDGQPKTTTDLLDAHLDNQQEMLQDMDDQGISRPADYNEKHGDMGLSEDEAAQDGPNLDEVLREGLDSHADSIQREKTVQLVGQALEGFKSQKAILDKAKEQAPELYSSCIDMLRAMIELCSLAGLDNAGEAEQEVNEIEGQGETPEEQPGAEEMPPEAAPEEKDACPNCGHPNKEDEEPEMPKEASPKSPQQ